MKLFTEEQVRSAIYLSTSDDYNSYSQILEQFKPIELPSDEEIDDKISSMNSHWISKDGWIAGVNWYKSQILKQIESC